MNKKILLIIPLLILFLSHCNTEKAIEAVHIQEKNNLLDVQINLVKEVKVEQDNEILTSASLYYDKAGNKIGVYGHISPEKDLLINIFDTDLNFEKTKILKCGQGPGEVSERTFIFPYKEKIIASVHIFRKVSIFDKDFHFIKSDLALRNGRFINKGNHILTVRRLSGRKGISFEFYVVAYPGFKEKKLATFGPYSNNFRRDKKNRSIFGYFPEFDYFYKNNTIFLVNLKNYTITTYSLAGNLLKKIIVDHKILKVPENMKVKWIKEWLGEQCTDVTFPDIVHPAAAAVPLGKGFVILRRKDYSMLCTDVFMEGDYFDYDLNLLGKVKIPCFFRGLVIIDKPIYTHHFQDGYLYTVTRGDDDRFILKKWLVKE